MDAYDEVDRRETEQCMFSEFVRKINIFRTRT